MSKIKYHQNISLYGKHVLVYSVVIGPLVMVKKLKKKLNKNKNR